MDGPSRQGGDPSSTAQPQTFPVRLLHMHVLLPFVQVQHQTTTGAVVPQQQLHVVPV